MAENPAKTDGLRGIVGCGVDDRTFLGPSLYREVKFVLFADNCCTYTEENGPEGNFYIFTGKCCVTGKVHSVKVPGEALYRYRQGALIQDAMPTVSRDDREFLMSGCSPEGWKMLWSEDYPEEVGLPAVHNTESLEETAQKAAQWAVDLYERRTYEVAAGTGSVSYLNPKYRVSWDDVVSEFPELEGQEGQSTFQPYYHGELRKRLLWEVYQGELDSNAWVKKHQLDGGNP